jgi:hypothetical protein
MDAKWPPVSTTPSFVIVIMAILWQYYQHTTKLLVLDNCINKYHISSELNKYHQKVCIPH